MKRTLALVALVALSLAVASPAAVAERSDVTRCLQFTTAQKLNPKPILAGLPLTVEQVREIRSRLTQYGSVHWKGFADLGLASDVITEISRRIRLQVAEWNRYPLGYPCPVFKSPARTKAFVRGLLIANGFRPASVSIRKTSPRQFQLRGIQDGVQFFGIVVKSASRRVTIYLLAPRPGPSETRSFATPFEA